RMQARREAEALRDRVKKTRTNAEQYARLNTEKTNKREAESLAKERYDSQAARQKQIKQTQEQISDLDKAVKIQESKISELKKEEQSAKELLATKRTGREKARAKRSEVVERQKLIG